MVAIIITCGSRENQVTAVTLAIQNFCAIIAFDDDDARSTWMVGAKTLPASRGSTTRPPSASCTCARRKNHPRDSNNNHTEFVSGGMIVESVQINHEENMPDPADDDDCENVPDTNSADDSENG